MLVITMKKILVVLIILCTNNVSIAEISNKSSKLEPCPIGIFDNCLGSYTFKTGYRQSVELKKTEGTVMEFLLFQTEISILEHGKTTSFTAEVEQFSQVVMYTKGVITMESEVEV